MNTLFRCLALFPLLALMAACCANNPCNCNDLQADSIYLTLKSVASSPADTTSFSTSELDTVYLQRYSPLPPSTLSDPVVILRAQRVNRAQKALLMSAGLDTTTVIISNTSPFLPSTTGGNLKAYNYLLTVRDGKRGSNAYRFRITNIHLNGKYKADGCCTCYQNTYKSFQVNGDSLVATETMGKPIPFILKK